MQPELLRKHLGARGLKLTKERVAVVREIIAYRGHFEPEQLYARIRAAGIKASRASVYRTVNILVESGLVEKVTRSGKGTVYEYAEGSRHHDHMICSDCGAFIEFFSPEIEALQQKICRSHRFEGTSHSLEIRGHCRECRSVR